MEKWAKKNLLAKVNQERIEKTLNMIQKFYGNYCCSFFDKIIIDYNLSTDALILLSEIFLHAGHCMSLTKIECISYGVRCYDALEELERKSLICLLIQRDKNIRDGVHELDWYVCTDECLQALS